MTVLIHLEKSYNNSFLYSFSNISNSYAQKFVGLNTTTSNTIHYPKTIDLIQSMFALSNKETVRGKKINKVSLLANEAIF